QPVQPAFAGGVQFDAIQHDIDEVAAFQRSRPDLIARGAIDRHHGPANSDVQVHVVSIIEGWSVNQPYSSRTALRFPRWAAMRTRQPCAPSASGTRPPAPS